MNLPGDAEQGGVMHQAHRCQRRSILQSTSRAVYALASIGLLLFTLFLGVSMEVKLARRATTAYNYYCLIIACAWVC
jgi:hypothetical protein